VSHHLEHAHAFLHRKLRYHGREAERGHLHGLVDRSILRSRAGVRAVLISLAVLAAAAGAQALVFVLSGSIALLADLIHNAGDALTALPIGAAFLLRSARAERRAGYAVVLAILVSACVALYETALRADGNHARVDAFVSLGVVASALAVGLGVEIADPLIGLAIVLVILKITWDSWRTVRHAPAD
jgi:divalent metal cation (Fe/Co/Zn/Cd) transporter